VGYAALLAGAIVFAVGVFLLNGGSKPEGSAVAEGQFFEIWTGPLAGTYYPLGNTIAAVISNPAGSVRCEDETRCGPPGLIAVVQSSAGSVENVLAVNDGRADSAFAQANVVNRYYRPDDPATPAFADLRAITGLYPEVVHLVVLGSSEIHTLADLRGKTISIDRPDSGTNGLARQILSAEGIAPSSVTLAEHSADRASELLRSGDIDAFFFVSGLPVPAVAELANWTDIRLVPIAGPEIGALEAAEPYLTPATIPAGTYGNNPETATLGVPALWLTHKDADPDVIYEITRALWNPKNGAMLAGGSPQARNMNVDAALSGVPIPFHPGASEFYREIGLFPPAETPDREAQDAP
jgi:hypothetical protein